MERSSRHQSGEKFGGAPDDLPADHLPSFGEITRKSNSEELKSIEAGLTEKWSMLGCLLSLTNPF